MRRPGSEDPHWRQRKFTNIVYPSLLPIVPMIIIFVLICPDMVILSMDWHRDTHVLQTGIHYHTCVTQGYNVTHVLQTGLHCHTCVTQGYTVTHVLQTWLHCQTCVTKGYTVTHVLHTEIHSHTSAVRKVCSVEL